MLFLQIFFTIFYKYSSQYFTNIIHNIVQIFFTIFTNIGVSRTIYVNVDTPNLGFTYFNFLGGVGAVKKTTLYFTQYFTHIYIYVYN